MDSLELNGTSAAIVLGIAGMSATAHAGRIWSSIGGGCVPADEDIQVNNYGTRGFGVGFKGVATGDIRLLCSVPVPSGATFRKFVMSYKDTDGMSAQARIRDAAPCQRWQQCIIGDLHGRLEHQHCDRE